MHSSEQLEENGGEGVNNGADVESAHERYRGIGMPDDGLLFYLSC